MDFLRSLVLRSLGEAGTVEPPRIPYVSLFPEGVAKDEDPAGQGEMAPPAADRQTLTPPEPAARAEPLEAAQPAQPRSDDPGETPAILPQPAQRPGAADIDTPSAPPVTPRATGEDAPAIVPSPPPAPPVAGSDQPRPEPPVQRQEIVRTTHQTTHIRDVQRVHHHSDRVVEREIVRPPSPVDQPVTRAPRERTPAPTIQPRPQPEPMPEMPVQAAPSERVEALAPQPAIHVSIGRVTVAVQAPAPPARPAERARPAAPAMDLDAYNARVRKPR